MYSNPSPNSGLALRASTRLAFGTFLFRCASQKRRQAATRYVQWQIIILEGKDISMKIKFIPIMTLAIVALSINGYSESRESSYEVKRIKKQVEMINLLDLRIIKIDKTFGKNEIKQCSDEFLFINEKYDAVCNYVYVFVDLNNKVRKIQFINQEQDHVYQSEYFEENGNLCFSQINMVNHAMGEWKGILYCNGATIFEINAYSDWGAGGKFQGDLKPVQKIVENNVFKFHYRIKDFEKNENISLSDINLARLYRSKNPQLNDISFVNAVNVIVRDKPSSNGAILDQITVMDNLVTILSVQNEEMIEPWGKYHWYNVVYSGQKGRVKGYIFGAFLEKIYEMKSK